MKTTWSKISFFVPPPTDPSKARIGFIGDAEIEFKRLSVKEQKGLLSKLSELAFNSDLGKPLVGRLQGNVRISFGRLRCVARCAEGIAVVLVLVVAKRAQGKRDDVYELAYKRVASADAEIKQVLAALIKAHPK